MIGPYSIVRVHWIDSCALSEPWSDPDDGLDIFCVSVGYRLRSEDGALYICQSLARKQAGLVCAIPLGAILYIEEFTP